MYGLRNDSYHPKLLRSRSVSWNCAVIDHTKVTVFRVISDYFLTVFSFHKHFRVVSSLIVVFLYRPLLVPIQVRA